MTDAQGTAFSDCNLTLSLPRKSSDPRYSSENLVSKKVSGEFEATMTGPPFRSTYLVGISCPGASTAIRSKPVEIGGRVPTDLGHIVLERE